MSLGTVAVDKMRPKLLTLDKYRERLAKDEPISTVMLDTSGSSSQTPQVRLRPGWAAGLSDVADTDPVDAEITIGRQAYQMSKAAVLTLASRAQVQSSLARNVPSHLVEPIINWKLENGGANASEQLLLHNGIALAVTKTSVVPFSNTALLDAVTSELRRKHGDDILVDYKSHASFRQTTTRLILPEVLRNPRDSDPWSVGIEIGNSPTGEFPTELHGYAFRWFCTNGCTTEHAAGRWNRRSSGQSPTEAYAWAKDQIDGILGGLEDEFTKLETAANTSVEGDVNAIMSDVFVRYQIPTRQREIILANMVESDDLTVYGVQQAITQAANAEGATPNDVTRLLRAGGQMTHDSERCATCRRAI